MTVLTNAQWREMARRAAAKNNLTGFNLPASFPGETERTARRSLNKTHSSNQHRQPHPLPTLAACGPLYPYEACDALAIAADYDLPVVTA